MPPRQGLVSAAPRLIGAPVVDFSPAPSHLLTSDPRLRLIMSDADLTSRPIGGMTYVLAPETLP